MLGPTVVCKANASQEDGLCDPCRNGECEKSPMSQMREAMREMARVMPPEIFTPEERRFWGIELQPKGTP